MPSSKPTSVRTDQDKDDAWQEYQAEQEAARERMAQQKAARRSAADVIRRKNQQ
jgi:hypothetical protein